MLEQLMPLHPKVVHFPIALFITALGFEILSVVFKKEPFHRTAWYLFVFASLMTVIVVRTGILEQARLHMNHPILSEHRTYALWTMWGALVALPCLMALKRFTPQIFRGIFLCVLILVSVGVSVTGHHGGRMVYEYGAGVSNQ